MTKESAKNCIFHVSSDGTTFGAVEGQNDTQFSGSGSPIDVSDKTSDGWGSTIQGLKSATVSLSGVCNWGSDTYYQILRDAWENQTEIDGRVIFNAAGNHYEGKWSVTQFDCGGSHDGATEFSFTLQNAGALTYAAAIS